MLHQVVHFTIVWYFLSASSSTTMLLSDLLKFLAHQWQSFPKMNCNFRLLFIIVLILIGVVVFCLFWRDDETWPDFKRTKSERSATNLSELSTGATTLDVTSPTTKPFSLSVVVGWIDRYGRKRGNSSEVGQFWGDQCVTNFLDFGIWMWYCVRYLSCKKHHVRYSYICYRTSWEGTGDKVPQCVKWLAPSACEKRKLAGLCVMIVFQSLCSN